MEFKRITFLDIITITLSENCMVPIAVAQKVLELRNNPDDAAMWLL